MEVIRKPRKGDRKEDLVYQQGWTGMKGRRFGPPIRLGMVRVAREIKLGRRQRYRR